MIITQTPRLSLNQRGDDSLLWTQDGTNNLSSFDVDQLPDHKLLPCEDGIPVKNFQEPDQADLLKESIRVHLQQLHPDGQYLIGRDNGIYWRLTDPPLRGAKAPDWFYVPNVSPLLAGETRLKQYKKPGFLQKEPGF